MEEYLDKKNDQNIGFKNTNKENDCYNINKNENLFKNNSNNYIILNKLLIEFGKIYDIDNTIFNQIINETQSNFLELHFILRETIGKNKELEFYKSKK